MPDETPAKESHDFNRAEDVNPEEHGIVLDRMGWDTTPRLDIAVRMARLFSETAHSRLSRLKECLFGSGVQRTEAAHVFERGTVHNWPGLTPCADWNLEGEWFVDVTAGDLSEEAFQRRHLGNAAKGVGWLAGQALAGVP